MSAVKRLIEGIMELWEEGKSISEIARELRLSTEEVEYVVEEYSNFFDF